MTIMINQIVLKLTTVGYFIHYFLFYSLFFNLFIIFYFIHFFHMDTNSYITNHNISYFSILSQSVASYVIEYFSYINEHTYISFQIDFSILSRSYHERQIDRQIVRKIIRKLDSWIDIFILSWSNHANGKHYSLLKE